MKEIVGKSTTNFWSLVPVKTQNMFLWRISFRGWLIFYRFIPIQINSLLIEFYRLQQVEITDF